MTVKRKFIFFIFFLIIIGLWDGTIWDVRQKVRSIMKKVVVKYFKVEMRDGFKLPTRVWIPKGKNKYPVVLERGYKAGKKKHAEAFTKAGYVYVGQQTRGNLQENMFFPDAKDGYDCLSWISVQPWCDGNIAMYGRSYQGATQWLVAPEQHPNLKAIIPQNINADLWERCYWDHGALQLAHTARRIYDIAGKEKVRKFGGWEAFHNYLPLLAVD